MLFQSIRVDQIETIFDDAHMRVVKKPAGWRLSAKTGGGGRIPSVWAALGDEAATWTPCHRMDDEIEGVAVLAKTKPALDFLSGEFQSKQAERLYVGFAVVASDQDIDRITDLPIVRDATGSLPDSFAVNYALAPERDQPGRMHVYRKKGGRRAVTDVLVKERFGRFVWFEARPETNREKQVQAHLAAIGAPVVGDEHHGLPEVQLLLSEFKRGYKGRDTEKPLVSGVALQGAAISLRHPESRERLTYELPLPKSFEIALRNLRKFARR